MALLGMNAKLYWGEADTALASLTLTGNVKDVDLGMTADEADVTTRDNSGWKATAPTLRECTLDFTMLVIPGDAAYEALRDAYLSSGEVCLAALTDAKDAAGAQGIRGNFAITNFGRAEHLTDAQSISVSAKMAKFIEWVEVEGGGGGGGEG